MNRRDFVRTTVSAIALAPFSAGLQYPDRVSMGVSIASYARRWRSEAESTVYPGFTNAIQVLKHCHTIGANGVQIGVGGWTHDFAGQVRDVREELGLYLEGQIRLPWEEGDLPKFEEDVKRAREAGATILRAVCLSGRRYETFETLEAFNEFKAASMAAIQRAEPILKNNQVKLGIENHKDWRIDELVAIMHQFDSEWIGVTLDTGNNMSLLEDPMEVVHALAPYTITTHFKDMSVKEYEDGFLLSEVPLGEGVLDLTDVVKTCKKYNPEVTLNLEMITRDPLKIPCKMDRYWETFNSVSGRDLARTFRMVESVKPDHVLPTVSDKTEEERLAFEEENVLKSFQYARQELGL
ncbi:MAG: sugar phosphate isomerase/epimerase [Rhodothermaceae bacterium]|nr:sugar phosphate isomerase/epimerase [Rhodothermaceae bacterium]